MDAPRLGWLKARLDEQPDRPTFIFMHHPPFPTGLQHMDFDQLPQRRGDGRAGEALSQRRARRLRPSPPLDPDPLGRHHRLGRAERRPPGRARPDAARRRHLHHGAAGLSPAPVGSRRPARSPTPPLSAASRARIPSCSIPTTRRSATSRRRQRRTRCDLHLHPRYAMRGCGLPMTV